LSKKIVVEAIGSRKGIGSLKFGDISGYKGDCAELDAEDAKKLIAASPALWRVAELTKRVRKEA